MTEETRKRLEALRNKWLANAFKSRVEAERIRLTIKSGLTDAEIRCICRAEVWDSCGGELTEALYREPRKDVTT